MANPFVFSPTALRAVRLGANMRQAALAQNLGVSQSALSSWENGDATPPAEAVYFLSKIFKMDISRFFVREQGSPKY